MTQWRDVYLQMAQLLQVDRMQVIGDAQRRLPDQALAASSSHAIRLAPVRTYASSGKTLTSGTFPGVAVPAFASHWGVVVGRTLYHLNFQNPLDIELVSGDLSREGKPIKFTYGPAEPDKIKASQIVGETRYDHETLISIGEALIEAFGSYHRLFWNCQVFADCFLYLIANGKSFVE